MGRVRHPSFLSREEFLASAERAVFCPYEEPGDQAVADVAAGRKPTALISRFNGRDWTRPGDLLVAAVRSGLVAYTHSGTVAIAQTEAAALHTARLSSMDPTMDGEIALGRALGYPWDDINCFLRRNYRESCPDPTGRAPYAAWTDPARGDPVLPDRLVTRPGDWTRWGRVLSDLTTVPLDLGIRRGVLPPATVSALLAEAVAFAPAGTTMDHIVLARGQATRTARGL